MDDVPSDGPVLVHLLRSWCCRSVKNTHLSQLFSFLRSLPEALPPLFWPSSIAKTLSRAALSLGGFQVTHGPMGAAMDVNMTEEMEEGARTP